MVYLKAEKTSFKEKVAIAKNKISFYFLILSILILASSLVQSVKRSNSINQEIERKKDLLENLKKEQEILKNKLIKVQSTEYIEKQLRDNLGLSREGEMVVILPDSDIVKKFAPKLETEEESLPVPNWKRWVKLFGLYK